MSVDFDSPEAWEAVRAAEEHVINHYMLLEQQVSEEEQRYKEQGQEAYFIGIIGGILIGAVVTMDEYVPVSHSVVGLLVGAVFAGAGIIHGTQNYLRHRRAFNR